MQIVHALTIALTVQAEMKEKRSLMQGTPDVNIKPVKQETKLCSAVLGEEEGWHAQVVKSESHDCGLSRLSDCQTGLPDGHVWHTLSPSWLNEPAGQSGGTVVMVLVLLQLEPAGQMVQTSAPAVL